MKYGFVSPDAGHRWNVHSHAMRKLLGVKELPVGGMPARMLRGRNELREPVSIKVWVRPLEGEAPRNALGRAQKRSAHRVRCECPGCGVELSAGRLFQHVCPPNHPATNSCDCADCRSTRASPSNPHGYVSRKECG